MRFSSVESEYLSRLIAAAIKCSAVPDVPDDIDWEKLISISKQQQVYSIIATVLDSDKLPAKQAEELNVYVQNELLRLLSMNAQLDTLKAEMKQNKIKFMLLKGSVIRDYYPKQKMRQMSDIDILYDYSKRDILLKIMKKQGFRLTTSCENSDDFFKEPFYTFEWHRELFFEEAEFCPHFDLWHNAIQDGNNPYEYHINDQDHFVYTVCHMYKHYATNGCGVRFLCDIYVLLNNCSNINLADAFESFEKIGIGEFAHDAVELASAYLTDGVLTDNQQKMLDYMLSNGVYGNHVVDYSKRISQAGGSKSRYLFKRLFPSKKEMFANYRKLEKYPYLLPAYYIIRLFEKLKYNSANMKKELNEIKKIK